MCTMYIFLVQHEGKKGLNEWRWHKNLYLSKKLNHYNWYDVTQLL